MRHGCLPRAIAGSLSGLLLLACACSPETSAHTGREAQKEVVPVVAVRAMRKDVPVEVQAIGRVEPSSSVAVRAQVDGQLARVHFREGENLRRGQLLFTIDARPYEALLHQAEANMARNRAEADNAAVELKRRATLLERGFISENEYDEAATRATALRAAVAADVAAVEAAQLQVQYCTIHSPIDGRVGQILVHEGNIVKRNDSVLAIINQLQPIDVAFAVPEQVLGDIRSRARMGPLHVEATAGSTRAGGTLSFVDNTVDPSTGTAMLKAVFPNADESLWPGQFVDVSLTLSVQHDAVVVPFTAVQNGQQGAYVFVVSPENAAEVRAVGVGATVGESVVITEGLDGHELVVTEGQLRLINGAAVAVRAPPASPASDDAGAEG
jgi:multidrug efflux system membrane fusion protein